MGTIIFLFLMQLLLLMGYSCHGSDDADDDWNDRIEFEIQSMLCYSEYWFPTIRRFDDFVVG